MQIIEQLPNYPITFFIIISRPECLLKCHLLNTFLCLFKYYVLSNGTRFVCAIKTIGHSVTTWQNGLGLFRKDHRNMTANSSSYTTHLWMKIPKFTSLSLIKTSVNLHFYKLEQSVSIRVALTRTLIVELMPVRWVDQ